MLLLEVQVALLGDGDKMDMGMRYFQADDGHADALAGHSLLDSLGYFLGEDHHGADFVVVEVEDVVILVLGHDQSMAFHHGIDVQESEETLVLSNLIARDFTLNDF